MKFGFFDHLDGVTAPTAATYEERLKLVELLDRSGFHAYHLAEHHSTLLGCAPSPSVFLAAVAQRTKQLRFGPLVYLLQLYHPLRVYEECCMLDQMSGGRFQLGIGRGGAVGEHRRYGIVDGEQGQAMYEEAFEVLMRAFQEEVLNHEDKYYTVRDFLTVIKPAQRPHPPLWYGSTNTPSAEWAAERGMNVLSLGEPFRAHDIAKAYRGVWAKNGHKESELPLIGIYRHVVVGETDAAALKLAREYYGKWRHTMAFLTERSGMPFPLAKMFPETWDELAAAGSGFAGSPETVKRQIAELRDYAQINYLACEMAFGGMDYAQASRSVELFAKEVMPAFA